MRRLLVVLALALFTTGLAFGQVAGTAHDLSAAEGNSETCVFCHTPHGATVAVPLWNHTASAGTFTAYDSATMNATDNNDWAGSGVNISALCMSCHDGVVGLGSLINESDEGGTPGNSATVMSGVAALGTDLSNDHPVAFTYGAALLAADPDLADPSTLTGAVGLFGVGNDQVECASCHDPHDDTNVPFLVVSNTGSSLCETCHTGK